MQQQAGRRDAEPWLHGTAQQQRRAGSSRQRKPKESTIANCQLSGLCPFRRRVQLQWPKALYEARRSQGTNAAVLRDWLAGTSPTMHQCLTQRMAVQVHTFILRFCQLRKRAAR